MKSSYKEFIEFKQELLGAYCILKYVSREDEQDYLEMFEEVNKRTKRILGRGSVATIMFPGDVVSYKLLPKKLKIYRGYHEVNKRHGISWSLSKQVADWFAHTCRAEGKKDLAPSVVEGTCSLSDVLAYTNDGGEEEIIIHPKNVQSIRDIEAGTTTLQTRKAAALEEILLSCG